MQQKGGGGGVEFLKFSEKKIGEGGSHISSHENRVVGKIDGVVFKKGRVSLIFIPTNPFQFDLSLSVSFVCVFCLFAPFLSVLSVFFTGRTQSYSI